MTAQCPVCEVEHDALERFGILFIVCPWAPPGMLYGFPDLRLSGTQDTAVSPAADSAPSEELQHREAQ